MKCVWVNGISASRHELWLVFSMAAGLLTSQELCGCLFGVRRLIAAGGSCVGVLVVWDGARMPLKLKIFAAKIQGGRLGSVVFGAAAAAHRCTADMPAAAAGAAVVHCLIPYPVWRPGMYTYACFACLTHTGEHMVCGLPCNRARQHYQRAWDSWRVTRCAVSCGHVCLVGSSEWCSLPQRPGLGWMFLHRSIRTVAAQGTVAAAAQVPMCGGCSPFDQPFYCGLGMV